MRFRGLSYFFSAAAVAVLVAAASGDEMRLSALDLHSATQGFGNPARNKSVDGHTLAIGGKTFAHGFGTHADSRLVVDLKGAGQKFTATVGVDDETDGRGSVEFKRHRRWQDAVVQRRDAGQAAGQGGRGEPDRRQEAGPPGQRRGRRHRSRSRRLGRGDARPTRGRSPRFCSTRKTPTSSRPRRRRRPASMARRSWACVRAARSCSRSRHRRAAPEVSKPPGCPRGCKLDPATGIITGAVEKKGTYVVKTSASNALGSASRDLRIVVGDQLALTPPLGWNSWNCFAGAVTEKNVKRRRRRLREGGPA